MITLSSHRPYTNLKQDHSAPKSNRPYDAETCRKEKTDKICLTYKKPYLSGTIFPTWSSE